MRTLPAQYRGPIKLNVVLQLIALVGASLILDGGHIGTLVGFAILGYWVGVLFIILRRRQIPGRLDVVFLGGGFVFLFFAIVLPVAWLTGQL